MIKKILVAYDNGNKAKKALEIAIDIARGSQAEIHIVVSAKMPDYISSVADFKMLQELESKSREYFAEVMKEPEERVKKEGIPVFSVVLDDRPGEAIISYADKVGIDLIVMGSANRGKVERFLLGLGSVSNYVLQHATCPVLITKD
ncbi:MAG: universal stress protein [Desulfotomaculaceae bacterium]|nr:universal stress protein [Desulfotomaculaceae bacterium]